MVPFSRIDRLDYQVVVVCEEYEGQPDPAIELVLVPKSSQGAAGRR